MLLKRKKTGEAIIFKEILEEREIRSFISKIDLRPYVHGIMHANLFAHVIPKNGSVRLNFISKEQKDKYLRLNKDDIVLLTPYEHQLFDHGTRAQRNEYAQQKAKEGITVTWSKLYDKKEKLIIAIQEILLEL